MVQCQRFIIQHVKRGGRIGLVGEEGSGGVAGVGGYLKRAKRKILSILFLSLLSCVFVFTPHIFSLSSTFSLLDSFGRESVGLKSYEDVIAPLCSGISYGTVCCDRSGVRSDMCIMKGDVRTHSPSSSVFLYSSVKRKGTSELKPEKIKPYTRKWEKSVMDIVQELNLVRATNDENSDSSRVCDVYHDVPAVFFSTGGYTGNVYHEFNDGIIPLYITSQHFRKRVVFVIVEYHDWWLTKYGDVVSELSGYPPVDFNGDPRTHCFREAIVGLRIHDELTVDSSLMLGNKTIVDFRNVLDRAYWPRIHGLIQDEEREAAERRAIEKLSMSPSSDSFKTDKHTQENGGLKKPKLVILSRNGSRAIINENLLVEVAEELGFVVEVLKPDRTTELPKIYRSLNSSDVMIGVHGAAMTHFLFMKPKSAYIQIIPLGTDWAAETYYGEPAKKLGLKYIGYKIMPKESSLYDEYDKDDPIIRDPKKFTARGWEYTKKIYLERQNVKLDLRRFRRTLSRAYEFCIGRTRRRVRYSTAV